MYDHVVYVCHVFVYCFPYDYNCCRVDKLCGMTNILFAGLISLKVLEHDVEHCQVHKTYLVVAVCVCKSNTDWRS